MTGLRQELIEGLKFTGLGLGDCVLVHSSLSSLGYVEGGAAAVIEAIRTVLGDEGTLIVPTLTGKREDSADNPPVFDVAHTKSWTGIIAETVRQMEGTTRSYHPTHSAAAIGKNAIDILQGHEKSKTPCDEASPYYKNAKLGGKILLIGVDQESNTTIHTCEELSAVPYHLQRETAQAVITGYNGEKITISNRLHEWNKQPTHFNRLEQAYGKRGIMTRTRIGNADIRLINATDMIAYTIDLLHKNPSFLLEEY